MNTRLRLTILAAVFALLTPATSMLHAQVLAPTEGIDTRKCIKPKDRAPKPNDLFAPLTCLEAVVNVSATVDNQAESFVNVNPTNTNNLVAFSNLPPTSTASSARTQQMAVRTGRAAPSSRVWRAATDRRPGTRSATCSWSISTTTSPKST